MNTIHDTTLWTSIRGSAKRRQPVPRARVRRFSPPTGAGQSKRRDKQSEAVERFTHKTFRTDWRKLLRELFARVVDGCPFAIGLFTEETTAGVAHLRGLYNFRLGKEPLADYVRRHFDRRHYEHITHSLEGLAQHEHFDLYKIVDPKLGVPINTLVYKIEHYEDPQLRAVILFGGERLEGQMETHLKLAAGILEQQAEGARLPAGEARDASSHARLIAMLRDADPRELRETDPGVRRWGEVRQIVDGLGEMEERFPERLKIKLAMLRKLLDEHAAPATDLKE